MMLNRNARFRPSIAVLLGVATTAALLLGVLGCDSGRSETLDELIEMEGGPEAVNEERIAELKEQIKQYQDIVEEKVEATGQLGVYYKMLAREYMDARNYGPALESIEEAIRIETANPVVFSLAGVAAGQLGKAAGTEEEAQRLFEKAERYYERSIELDNQRFTSLYGLAVLYAFELDRPADALDLLEQATEVRPSDARAYMVKGRVLLELNRPEEAAEAYADASEAADTVDMREAASENRRQILNGTEGESAE